MAYNGWLLDGKSRRDLMKVFVPKFPDVFAHHVTLKFGGEMYMPKIPKTARVVGYASDDSLECLVIEIDGTSTRPDGQVYHITWSLDASKARKPVQSNGLLKKGYTKINPIDISLVPQIFK